MIDQILLCGYVTLRLFIWSLSTHLGGMSIKAELLHFDYLLEGWGKRSLLLRLAVSQSVPNGNSSTYRCLIQFIVIISVFEFVNQLDILFDLILNDGLVRCSVLDILYFLFICSGCWSEL